MADRQLTNLMTTGFSLCAEPTLNLKPAGLVQCAPIETGRERALDAMNGLFEGMYVNARLELCCKQGSACNAALKTQGAADDVCKVPAYWDQGLTLIQHQAPVQMFSNNFKFPSAAELSGQVGTPEPHPHYGWSLQRRLEAVNAHTGHMGDAIPA